MTNEIPHLLHRLGITGNYRGYPQLVLALQLLLKDEDRLLSMKELVYIPISHVLKCTPAAVERNLRTVVLIAWHTNKRLLCDITPFPLISPPSVTQFLDILAEHLRHTYRLPRKDRLSQS